MLRKVFVVAVLLSCSSVSFGQLTGWSVSSTFCSADADIIGINPPHDLDSGASFAQAEETIGGPTGERAHGTAQWTASSPVGTFTHTSSTAKSLGRDTTGGGYVSANLLPSGYEQLLANTMAGTIVINKAADQKKALASHGFGWWELEIKYDRSVNPTKFHMIQKGPDSNNNIVIIYDGWLNATSSSPTALTFSYDWTQAINSTDWINEYGWSKDLTVDSRADTDCDDGGKRAFVSNNNWLSD